MQDKKSNNFGEYDLKKEDSWIIHVRFLLSTNKDVVNTDAVGLYC